MKSTLGRLSLLLVGLCLLFYGVVWPDRTRSTQPSVPPSAVEASLSTTLANLPLDFIENRGQWDAAVKFAARKGSLTAFFADDAIQLHLGANQPTLGLTFEGASQNVTLVGEEKHGGYYNFFIGNDPAKWQSRVAAYGSVLYRGLYEGIDVRVREAAERLVYDVMLAPGADLEQVVIHADGTSGIELASDGSLILETASGPLRQTQPTTWEVLLDGEKRPIESRFRIVDAQRFGFEAPGHDPALALVVDPGLDWATFVGGSGDETVEGLVMTSDGSGDIVLAGQTWSPDFPRTGGNLVPTGLTPYVARLNATGTALVYATLFGGSFNHSVLDVALDASGAPAVVGDTNSLDFPTTPGAFDRTPGNGASGDYDAYVIKFDATGSGLVFGTYLGGSPGTGSDVARHVGFDPFGAVIVSGTTGASDFPTTPGAYPGQPGLFVSRLDPTGSQLTYSAFLGPGSPYAMVVDGQGFVTLTGQTASATFPTTADAFDPTSNGNADAFVARLKLDGAGAADLRYSTYLGGAQWIESANGVAVDPNDPELVTVVGFTRSGDFPTTAGALQRTHPVPVDGSVAFVTRFRFPAAGVGSLLWSTLFGAPGNQHANDVVVDSTSAAIIVGGTAVNNPLTTERAFDRVPNKTVGFGTSDAFVARISSDGSQLLYSTLLGGFAGESGQDIVYAGGTSVVVAGLTNSPDFPVTVGAFDPVYAADGRQSGGSTPGTLADDAYISRLTLEAPAAGDTTPPPAPELRWPPEGATYTAHVLAVPFDWTDIADASGIEAYHVQISPNPTFTNDLTAELNGWFEPWMPASLVVKGFSISETGARYWRVQALDRAGNLGPWSAVRSITVQDPQPPPAPTLLSPPNNGQFAPGSVTFAWNAAPGAKFYTIQVDDQSDFRSPVLIYVQGLVQTQYTASLTAERRYWWRVRGSNDSFTDGPWSTVWSFEIKNGSPPAPVPPAPTPTPTPTGSTGPALASITPAELGLSGGTGGQLTVNLAGAAPPGGAVVSLASVYPQRLNVPPSVTVPEGSTSASFTVTAASAQVHAGAAVVGEYGGVLQAATVNIFANEPVIELNSFTVSATTVLGGDTVQGTVALLTGWLAPPGGALVALGSTNPALASVPASVTIPQGASSATFIITTQPVASATTVTILASRSFTLKQTLELLPPGALASLSLNPTTVTGGQSSQGTVTLSSPAPAGGVVVALSSLNTAVAQVPASVTVPAGASSATFTISTSPVFGSGTWSQITASAGGLTRWANLNVNPAPPGTVVPTATPTPIPPTATPAAPTPTPAGSLPAPSLLSPAHDARFSPGQTITFDWSDVAGAASYTIQIDDAEAFSSPLIVNQTVTASVYTNSTLPTTRMWWRVRANDAAGNPGAWSAVRRFEVRN